jgi:hypothetical protein
LPQNSRYIDDKIYCRNIENRLRETSAVLLQNVLLV